MDGGGQGLSVPFFLNQQHTAVAGFFPYGRVMYEHGGGIDAPVGAVRMEYSSELHDPQVIVPHSDWRGTYDRGTTIVGSCLVYSSNGKQLAPPPDSTPSNPDAYGGVAGGGTYDGTKEHCIDVDWPGAYTWSARQYRRGYGGPDSWMGSLIFESRDASGLYYRRNRYYDSEKGRFTQEDPVGLAGGLNVYGFAAGDPISFGDPSGLCPTPPWDCVEVVNAAMNRLISGAVTAVAVAGELSGISGLMRAASGEDASGRTLGLGERAFEFGMAALTVSPMPEARSVPLVSRIKEVPALVRIASRLEGTVAQRGVDALTEQLAHGNLNPGLGSKHLFSGIHEARAANGGRVYFRNTEVGLEILAKSDKSTQSQVISILRQVYGH